jgi:hypothetical protein
MVPTNQTREVFEIYPCRAAGITADRARARPAWNLYPLLTGPEPLLQCVKPPRR